MIWKVKTKDGVVNIGPNQLVSNLISNYEADAESPDYQTLVDSLADALESQGLIRQMNMTELIISGFIIGSKYRSFIRNNTVEIVNASPSD